MSVFELETLTYILYSSTGRRKYDSAVRHDEGPPSPPWDAVVNDQHLPALPADDITAIPKPDRGYHLSQHHP